MRLVFLPDLAAVMDQGVDFAGTYSYRVTGQVAELCAVTASLVGYSLMTNYFPKISALTRAVGENTGLPSVWGGVHPTIAPDECAGVADYVCVGEGEGAILELANTLDAGGDTSPGTPNIVSARNGKPVQQPAPSTDPGSRHTALPRLPVRRTSMFWWVTASCR